MRRTCATRSHVRAPIRTKCPAHVHHRHDRTRTTPSGYARPTGRGGPRGPRGPGGTAVFGFTWEGTDGRFGGDAHRYEGSEGIDMFSKHRGDAWMRTKQHTWCSSKRRRIARPWHCAWASATHHREDPAVAGEPGTGCVPHGSRTRRGKRRWDVREGGWTARVQSPIERPTSTRNVGRLCAR